MGDDRLGRVRLIDWLIDSKIRMDDLGHPLVSYVSNPRHTINADVSEFASG